MKQMVGPVLLKNLAGMWRSLDFVGFSFSKRWFFGFVRFEHHTDNSATQAAAILSERQRVRERRRQRGKA